MSKQKLSAEGIRAIAMDFDSNEDKFDSSNSVVNSVYSLKIHPTQMDVDNINEIMGGIAMMEENEDIKELLDGDDPENDDNILQGKLRWTEYMSRYQHFEFYR